MDKNRQQRVYELLKRGLKLTENGDNLPVEWAREFFPPERREYELIYHGKESEEQILADTMAVPLQAVSTFGRNGVDWHNKLIFGDNLQAMKTLLQMKEEGKLVNANGTTGARLIYIDPPFSTKRDFRGSQDQKAYQDKIAGAEFLEFLRKRLVFLKELLSDDGSIYVHLDWKKAHYVKILMDEVFGENHLRNEIIWFYPRGGDADKQYNRKHDTILYYSKSDKWVFNWDQILVPYSPEQLKRFKHEDKNGRYYWNVNPRGEKGKTYLRKAGIGEYDVWTLGINATEIKDVGYPTAKPPKLLEKIIMASSNEGDIVFDAFAGSGTACVVAEKLQRRWIAIDCGKLAVYTIQKRMFNLHSGVDNSGKKLNPRPFALYNAGLYDFETLRSLPWKDWRFFALQLFECKDEPHKIHGFQMDGKRQGSSVFVFDHFNNKAGVSRGTIADLHASVGKVIGDRCFIIAPRGAFLFQEDFIELDRVRYYALRIPYSFINELHRREFSALTQPNDEMAVNDTVEAVGFDFIQPPLVELQSVAKRGSIRIKVKKFESHARIRGEEKVSKLDSLSMVMVDLNYDGKIFDLDHVFYAHALQEKRWEIDLPFESVVGDVMLVFLDIYGNESKVLLKMDKLIPHGKVSSKRRKSKRSYAETSK